MTVSRLRGLCERIATVHLVVVVPSTPATTTHRPPNENLF